MSRFRTTEISDPFYERDGLRHITVKSEHLRGRGDICVYVPNGIEISNLPICILLHGVYGSAWAWAMKGAAHLTAARLIEEGHIRPMMLAMPSDGLWGDGSGYLKHSGYDFEKWIVEDVIDAVRLLIPQASASEQTFISGLSMGGYGALRLAAKYPDRFAAVSAHSSITQMSDMTAFVVEELSDYHGVFPDPCSVVDVMMSHRDRLPSIRFDCGTQDDLLDANRSLHQQLRSAEIAHQYHEYPGGHEWPYWIEHLEDTLRFFDEFA